MNYPAVNLGEFIRANYGKALKKAERDETGSWDVFGSSGFLGKHSESLTPEPTIIIGRKGSVGAITYAPNGGWTIDTAFYVDLLDNEKLDLRYLYYALVNSGLDKHTITTSIPGINRDNIYGTKIPLPPLPEQRRIAAILDKADAIRRKRQQAIRLTEEFLRSVFLDMFGDPVLNPKEWEVGPVGNYTDCIVPGRDKPKSFTGLTPWVTTNELAHLGKTYSPKKFKGLTEEEIKEVRARVVPETAVIMTCVGDLGVVSIAGVPMVINQQLHAFLIEERLDAVFLMYALSYQKDYMLKMASSTTLPYMNKVVCNSVPIIVPPLENQEKFGLIFYKVQESFEKFGNAICDNDNLFNSLVQRAFRGEL